MFRAHVRLYAAKRDAKLGLKISFNGEGGMAANISMSCLRRDSPALKRQILKCDFFIAPGFQIYVVIFRVGR